MSNSAKKTTIEVEVTITVEIEVEINPVFDDDGCGSPSKTGNSMTGNRGQRGWEVTDYKIDESGALANIKDYIDIDLVQEIVDDEDIE